MNAVTPPLPPPSTVAGLIAAVEADAELSPTRKRDLASALRGFCRVLHLQPADTPAGHAFFRKRLAAFHPKQAGLSEKTFQNMRAGVNAALLRYVPAERRPTLATALSEPWSDLWQRLPATHARYNLSRFFRFCAGRGLAPDQVDESLLADFGAWLTEETFVRNPGSLIKATTLAWNKAVASVPGWPQCPLTREPARPGYCLKWDALPASLRQEIEAWLSRNADPDPLDEDGPSKPLRPATLKQHRFALRQIASALVLDGVPLQELTSLADLVRPDRAKRALRFFLSRNGGQPSGQSGHMAGLIAAVAQHWAKLPEKDLDQLRRMRAKVTPRQTGLRATNRERLRQFDSLRNKELLVRLPETVLAGIGSSPSRRDALAVQAALAVEILLMLPIRLGNLHRIHLDRHLRRQKDHGRTRLMIVIPGEEVKNGAPIEAELPAGSARLLETYLVRFRPMLTDGNNRWLFPGALSGEPKSPEQLGRQIQTLVFRRTGLRVNPHLFRHVGAKLYLDENPGGYEVIRRVLGHNSMATTANSYTGLETASATRHFDETILKLRRRARGVHAHG